MRISVADLGWPAVGCIAYMAMSMLCRCRVVSLSDIFLFLMSVETHP